VAQQLILPKVKVTMSQLQVDTIQTTTNTMTEQPATDNFYTPKNYEYYKNHQFANLRTGQDKNQFRLFKVNPLKILEDGIVKGELIDKLVLSEWHGKYHTVSYYAGNPKDTRLVYVDGFEFNAFANLHRTLLDACTFLAQPLISNGTQYIWADQICVDQSNNTERSHQVMLMRSIYKNPRYCLVSFPGTDDEKLLGGLEWLQRYSQADGKTTKEMIEAEIKSHKAVQLKSLEQQLSEVYAIGAHPWWRRAWVQQEFFLPKEVIFLQNKTSMDSYEVLFAMASFRFWLKPTVHKLRKLRSIPLAPAQARIICGPEDPDRDLDMCIDMLQYRSKALNGLNSELINILFQAYRYAATDPRDQIYALLGLTGVEYNVIPNYQSSNTITDVLIQVARAITFAEQNLNILAFACLLPGRNKSLPSWVPDWTCCSSPREYSIPMYVTYKNSNAPQNRMKDYEAVKMPSPGDYEWPENSLRAFGVQLKEKSREKLLRWHDRVRKPELALSFFDEVWVLAHCYFTVFLRPVSIASGSVRSRTSQSVVVEYRLVSHFDLYSDPISFPEAMSENDSKGTWIAIV
jgi:hypothetical protein